MSLKAIDMKELKFNPMTLIGKEWMLVSAGNEKSFNTMTAQWGPLGRYMERRYAYVGHLLKAAKVYEELR